MQMTSLTEQNCKPCEGGVDPMTVSTVKEYLEEVDEWDLIDVPKITKNYTFSDFKEAIAFVDEIAKISEQENHHPNIKINYNNVEVTIWTHAIDGLSENDFILAAKFDEVAKSI